MDLVGLVLKGKIFEMEGTKEGEMFFVKQIEDLEALMDCLDHLQYLTRHELMLLAFEKVAFPKMSKSSTNKRWWIAEQCLEILRPLIDPALSALNNSLERTSEPMMKRKGKLDLLVSNLFWERCIQRGCHSTKWRRRQKICKI